MLALHQNSHTRVERAKALLCELGLEQRLYQYPNQLSAGERQRVAIARALANQPSIVLADEPTGNLDSANSAKIMEILIGIQRSRGMTLVVVTHEDEIANAAPRPGKALPKPQAPGRERVITEWDSQSSADRDASAGGHVPRRVGLHEV